MIRQLPIQSVKKMPNWKRCSYSLDAPKNELLEVRCAKVVLGKSKDDDFYGWDNEYGYHESTIPNF